MLNIKTNGVCLTLHEFENTPGRSKKKEARRTPSEEVRLPWVISVCLDVVGLVTGPLFHLLLPLQFPLPHNKLLQ